MTPQERSKANHRKHKELWNWCAETGKLKEDYSTLEEDMFYWDYCYACKEAEARQKRMDFKCDCCPIQWANGGQCWKKGSEFDNWADAETTEERKYWAKKIANKRWREPEDIDGTNNL